jgi:hypothetical protein
MVVIVYLLTALPPLHITLSVLFAEAICALLSTVALRRPDRCLRRRLRVSWCGRSPTNRDVRGGESPSLSLIKRCPASSR